MLIGVALGDTATFFPVEGAEHGFEFMLYLGDPKLEIVERAWKALDTIVEGKES